MRRSLTLRRTWRPWHSRCCWAGWPPADPTTREPIPRPRRAPPTESEESSETEAGGEVDKAGFVDDLKAGSRPPRRRTMTMHMDMGGQAIHADGEADYTTTPPRWP